MDTAYIASVALGSIFIFLFFYILCPQQASFTDITICIYCMPQLAFMNPSPLFVVSRPIMAFHFTICLSLVVYTLILQLILQFTCICGAASNPSCRKEIRRQTNKCKRGSNRPLCSVSATQNRHDACGKKVRVWMQSQPYVNSYWVVRILQVFDFRKNASEIISVISFVRLGDCSYYFFSVCH